MPPNRIPTAPSPQGERPSTGGRPIAHRSRVTNGRHLYIDGDEESRWSRRYRDLKELHEQDLGGGAFLSEAQVSLCRRAAALEVKLEGMEADMSRGVDVDFDKYGRGVGQLRRVLETLGIERKSKDVTPTLSTYLAQKAERQAAA